MIKAIPIEVPGLREMQRRMRELAHENARLRESASRNVRELAGERLPRSAARGSAASALIDAHDQLLRRDEEIRRAAAELASRANRVRRGILKKPDRAVRV